MELYRIFLVAVLAFRGVESVNLSSYKDRRKCSYWQQSGCFLMSLERFCELPSEVLQEDLSLNIKLLERCCCPLPFKKCTDIEEDGKCRHLYEESFLDSKNPVKSKKDFITRITQIRKKLLESDKNCTKYLAASEPFTCSPRQNPQFTRPDLRCELLAWQFEELAIATKSQFEENKCPFVEENIGYATSGRFVSIDEMEALRNEHGQEIGHTVEEYSVKSYEDRRSCVHWQQSGCILDVIDRACQLHRGQKKILYRLFSGRENVFMCCCPDPYKPCKKRDADQVCLEVLSRSFVMDSIDISQAIGRDDLIEGLKRTREKLLEPFERCRDNLSPAKPPISCTKDGVISRRDLKCEQLKWRWEELGEGTQQDFEAVKCPFSKKEQGKNTKKRIGGEGFLPDEREEL